METITSPRHLGSTATLHCDLRSASIPSKRQATQNEKYHRFRGRVYPGDVGLPYLDCPELFGSAPLPWWEGTRDEVERKGKVNFWTKRDMFVEAQKAENYWPLRPPHHHGRCRMCHESGKGLRKRKWRLLQEELMDGLDEWETSMWEHDWRACPVCEQERKLRDRDGDGDGEIIWGLGSTRSVMPVLLRGICTTVPRVEPADSRSERASEVSSIGSDFSVVDNMSDGILSAGGWDLLDDDQG